METLQCYRTGPAEFPGDRHCRDDRWYPLPGAHPVHDKDLNGRRCWLRYWHCHNPNRRNAPICQGLRTRHFARSRSCAEDGSGECGLGLGNILDADCNKPGDEVMNREIFTPSGLDYLFGLCFSLESMTGRDIFLPPTTR